MLFEINENDYWGGKWTQDKIEIFIKYLKAYLTIMNKQSFQLIYFDGFAGSGQINPGKDGESLLESVALQVLSITDPRSFDIYYMVELDPAKAASLRSIIDNKFPNVEEKYVVEDDCNKRLVRLAEFLNKNPGHRALAFLDPFGMDINWDALKSFQNVGCDMWILFPSGMGVNRLLTKNGKISEAWLKRLNYSLGLTEEEVMATFYSKDEDQMKLFNIESQYKKESNPIHKIIDIYSERLKSIWKYVSIPYSMKNSKGSVMFHFLLVSQKRNAVKIGEDIIKLM